MKTILNIIISVLILFIWSDIETNANLTELDYSKTIFCLAGILFFGFFRANWDEFLTYLNKR